MSKKLDGAIEALVDALAELPEHELEGWQRGNRLGLRILCELVSALSRHRAGDGAGSPQVGLSALLPILLAMSVAVGGPVRACRARRDVDCRRLFIDKGQFVVDALTVVVTRRGILDHFAQQGASGHGMVFAQNRCHAS